MAFTLIDRIGNTRCAMEIHEDLRLQLQTITENDLRGTDMILIMMVLIYFHEGIHFYINAAQLEKSFIFPKNPESLQKIA